MPKSITVLKLKLALSDEQAEQLSAIAERCREGRNAGAEDWLLRMRGMPESEKQQGNGRPKNGKPAQQKSESTKIYHAIRSASPGLNSQVHSSLAAGVASFIAGKLDWRDRAVDPEAKRRKDAILRRKMRAPFFTALEIPIPNCITSLSFDDEAHLSFRVNGCEKAEGNGQPPLALKLSMRRLSGGIKRILRELSNGERKLADSKILYRKEQWYWYVPVKFEREPLGEEQATLWPTIGEGEGQMDRPFQLELPDRTKPWGIGDGRYLIAQTMRLTKLRKEIGWRYRQRTDAGHGRRKVDAAVRKRWAQLGNVVTEVRRRAIRDIVRQCERSGAGRLLYREPSLPVRQASWFESKGLSWDWTRFYTDLTNACSRAGITVEKQMLKIKEAREQLGEQATEGRPEKATV